MAGSCEFAAKGTFAHRALLEFVRSELNLSRGWDPYRTTAMGVFQAQDIAGAVVFHDWNPEAGTMCMSAAGRKGWLTLEAIYRMHSYVFDGAGCQLAVLQVAEDNDLMRRTAEHFGYVGHVIPRLRGRDKAEVIYTLTEEVWRDSPFTARAARNVLKYGDTRSCAQHSR